MIWLRKNINKKIINEKPSNLVNNQGEIPTFYK